MIINKMIKNISNILITIIFNPLNKTYNHLTVNQNYNFYSVILVKSN